MDEIAASLGGEALAGEEKSNLIRWMERHMWRHVDCTYLGAGGRRVPVTLSLSPLLDSDGAYTGYIVVAKDTSEQRAHETAEKRRQYIERAVQGAHAGFIIGKSTNATMETLLDDTLDLTECEYGFIGEILKDGVEAPYLHTFAITDIAWDQTTREFYDTHRESGLIFSNLNTLFGRVMTAGQPVLSGHPSSDPRSGGLPPGHPPMYNFCGVPIHFGHELVGMIGLANYPTMPDDALVESLRPLTNACGAIFHATRLERQRREAIDQLRVEQQQTAAVLESAVEAFIEIDPGGRVVKWNSAAEREFLTRTADAVGRSSRVSAPTTA
jgi:PAS domain-containing protein